jgi:flagellar hook-associated protein 3 FlgL
LLGFANQKDSRGDYLFAGSKGGTQPYQTDQFGNFATIAYHGDSSQRYVQISSTRQIADSDTGASVFSQIKSNKAVYVPKNPANTGDAEVAKPYLKNPDPLEITTLKFADANTGTAGGIITGTSAGAGDTLTLGEVTYQFVTDKRFVSNGNVAVKVANGATASTAITALEEKINDPYLLPATHIKTGTKTGSSLVLQATKHGIDSIAANGIIANNASYKSAIESVVSKGGPAIDNYQIEFTGATNYTITNTTTGVKKTSGYTNGNKIEIDGMEFAIKGEPKAGDIFTIKPSKYQDSFTTMNKLLAVLKVKNNSDKNKATISAGLGQTLVDLDAMLGKLNETQTSVGGRLNALGSQKKSNGDVIFQLEKTHSSIADIDIVGAISTLEFEKINLQAGQQSFIKLQGLSLFNFL